MLLLNFTLNIHKLLQGPERFGLQNTTFAKRPLMTTKQSACRYMTYMINCRRVKKYGHVDVPIKDNTYILQSFASTNKSSPQIRRPFNESARLPHRPRRCIDRPPLQPHRCHAGAYVYEYNVSLSGTPPSPPPVAVLSAEHHPASQLRGETRTDCTRPLRHLHYLRIVHISSARRHSPYNHPLKIFLHTFGNASHLCYSRVANSHCCTRVCRSAD